MTIVCATPYLEVMLPTTATFHDHLLPSLNNQINPHSWAIVSIPFWAGMPSNSLCDLTMSQRFSSLRIGFV